MWHRFAVQQAPHSIEINELEWQALMVVFGQRDRHRPLRADGRNRWQGDVHPWISVAIGSNDVPSKPINSRPRGKCPPVRDPRHFVSGRRARLGGPRVNLVSTGREGVGETEFTPHFLTASRCTPESTHNGSTEKRFSCSGVARSPELLLRHVVATVFSEDD